MPSIRHEVGTLWLNLRKEARIAFVHVFLEGRPDRMCVKFTHMCVNSARTHRSNSRVVYLVLTFGVQTSDLAAERMNQNFKIR